VPERTEGTIDIRATPARIMEVITDFEAYPEWAQGVERAEVRRRDGRGRPVEVAFRVGQMGVGASYTLDYTYRPGDRGLAWTSRDASGVVRRVEGEYVLEPAGGRTTVTYRTTVELAVPMVGPVKRQAERMIVAAALEGLKRRAEQGEGS
jgi:ribosome-associated toxin RatA of RatAB toxin-antitoxin module